MKTLYQLGGCNGAGKTTAAYARLLHVLGCNALKDTEELYA